MFQLGVVEAGAGGHNVQVVLVLSGDGLVLAVITIIAPYTEAMPIHQVGGDGGHIECSTSHTNTCQLLVTCLDV